ncbi:MAG: hypothetical protein RLZZ127_1448 [Planctomycetota bacterium]|jgi:hypothetical protein
MHALHAHTRPAPGASPISTIRTTLLHLGLGRPARPELQTAIALCERFRVRGEAIACPETIAAARGIAHRLDRHLEDGAPLRAADLSHLHRLLDRLATTSFRPESP